MSQTTLPMMEGTWEEILRHASELTGRRLRVLVLPDLPETAPWTLEEFEAGMDAFSEGTEHLPVSSEKYDRECIYSDHD